MLQAKGAYVSDIPGDVVVHDLKVQRVRYALPRVIALIWRTRPNTVVSTLGHLNIALAMFRHLLPRRVRIVVRETIIVSALLPEETRHPRLWTWLYRQSYKQADRVICLSDSMVEDMVAKFGLPRDKIVRIYNPADVERVREQATLGMNPYSGPGPHLVGAGRLTRQKGFDILLEAMPEVLQAFPTATLTILGEGPLKETLREQSQRLGIGTAVYLAGFESNPWPYLKHADVFVLPSRYEGLPNVMLEALALGTPVVAADCPGAIREMRDLGTGIILVPMEDPVAVARAIISNCGLKATRVEAPKEYMSVFDLQQIVNEYTQLF